MKSGLVAPIKGRGPCVYTIAPSQVEPSVSIVLSSRIDLYTQSWNPQASLKLFGQGAKLVLNGAGVPFKAPDRKLEIQPTAGVGNPE